MTMKLPLKHSVFYLFLWTFFFTGISFAQTFQAPTNSVYTCFSSQESPLDANAQQIGTLEINKTSYTFTVGNNSETGTVAALEEELAETFPFATAGSAVTLTSAINSVIVGFFVVDASGGSYILTNNAQGVWIRCDSPGADILAAVKGSSSDPAPTPTTTIPSTLSADAPEPGHYTCYAYDEYTTDVSEYKDGDVVDTDPFIGSLDLFADGQYSYYDGERFLAEYGVDTLGVLEWPEETGFYSFHYNPDRYDPGYTSLDWLTGGLRSKFYNETDISEFSWDDSRDRPSSFYTGDNSHTEIFLSQEEEGFDVEINICTWAGPNERKPPHEVMQTTENPETYLQPASVVAPAPAAGAGGLSGLYSSEEGRPLYFLPNGYFMDGTYRWGFDSLSNVCGRVWTEEENGYPVCDTYLLQGNSVQLGERVPESQEQCELESKYNVLTGFSEYTQVCSPIEGYNPVTDSFLPFSQNTDGSLTIEGVQYIPVAPEQNLTLDGSYESSWSSVNSNFASGGTSTITFTPDGQFVYAEDSYSGAFTTTYYLNDTSTTSINENQNPNAGTYSINGYTITLSFNTGLNLTYSFFRTGEDSFKLLNDDFTRAEPEEE
jgi:hypothetical protein